MGERKLTKAHERLRKNNPDVARLLAKATVGDECWQWTGASTKDGYGFMAFRGRTWKAHRVSYTLFHGEVPEGLFVCHHCDNPGCVNPQHLFLGHASANVADMVRKGRGVSQITSDQNHFKAGHAPRGQDASGHKMTEEDAVRAIDMAARGILTSHIALMMGVDRTAIQQLLRGQTWKHLPRPPGLPKPVGRPPGRSALEASK